MSGAKAQLDEVTPAPMALSPEMQREHDGWNDGENRAKPDVPVIGLTTENIQVSQQVVETPSTHGVTKQGQYAQAQPVQYQQQGQQQGQPVYVPQGQMQQGQMQQGQMQQTQVNVQQQGQADHIVAYRMGGMAWCMVCLLILIFWPLC